MRRFLLDTSVLVRHWRGCRTGKKSADIKEVDAELWARRLIEIEDTNAIVTPVLLEYLCGVRDQLELGLARAYLKPFHSVDGVKPWSRTGGKRNASPNEFRKTDVLAISAIV